MSVNITATSLMGPSSVQQNDFTPIPLSKLIGDVLIHQGDIAFALLQASLADKNNNGMIDSNKEYNDYIKKMEDAPDTSYSELDFSSLRKDSSLDYSI